MTNIFGKNNPSRCGGLDVFQLLRRRRHPHDSKASQVEANDADRVSDKDGYDCGNRLPVVLFYLRRRVLSSGAPVGLQYGGLCGAHLVAVHDPAALIFCFGEVAQCLLSFVINSDLMLGVDDLLYPDQLLHHQEQHNSL